MKRSYIHDVVLIGAGRLASALGGVFKQRGITIVQVCNRNTSKGQRLARKLGAGFTASPDMVTRNADLYIIAVSDNAIADVVGRLGYVSGVVVHASGSVDMRVLQSASAAIGVFYPLMTFTANSRVRFDNIPVLIEAGDRETLGLLTGLASQLTSEIELVDSDRRKIVHLAAVFASNFPNFMMVMAEELISSAGLSGRILYPLVNRTAGNIKRKPVFSGQTGPAVRGDDATMEMHRMMLSSRKDMLEIYTLISNKILTYKSLHGEL